MIQNSPLSPSTEIISEVARELDALQSVVYELKQVISKLDPVINSNKTRAVDPVSVEGLCPLAGNLRDIRRELADIVSYIHSVEL